MKDVNAIDPNTPFSGGSNTGKLEAKGENSKSP